MSLKNLDDQTLLREFLEKTSIIDFTLKKDEDTNSYIKKRVQELSNEWQSDLTELEKRDIVKVPKNDKWHMTLKGEELERRVLSNLDKSSQEDAEVRQVIDKWRSNDDPYKKELSYPEIKQIYGDEIYTTEKFNPFRRIEIGDSDESVRGLIKELEKCISLNKNERIRTYCKRVKKSLRKMLKQMSRMDEKDI